MADAYIGWRKNKTKRWAGVVGGRDRGEAAGRLLAYLAVEKGDGLGVVLPAGQYPEKLPERYRGIFVYDHGRATGRLKDEQPTTTEVRR